MISITIINDELKLFGVVKMAPVEEEFTYFNVSKHASPILVDTTNVLKLAQNN